MHAASLHVPLSFFFFFNDPATTEIYTLSLHDALPIFPSDETPGAHEAGVVYFIDRALTTFGIDEVNHAGFVRSEEHTSELQSLTNLVCRLLLEKKKNIKPPRMTHCASNIDVVSSSHAA